MGLKRKALSASRWTATSALIRSGLQLLQTVVLARLLLPADFGLMALTAALLAVVGLFADLGLSRAIIHFQHIPKTVLSSLYWLNTLMAILLTALLAVSAVPIAWLYNEPALQSVLVMTSPVFVLTALGQQFCVLAEKELRFEVLAQNEVAAAFAGFSVAVVVALAGGGVLALVAGLLVTAATGSLLAWWRLSAGHRPALRLRTPEAKPYLGYGAYLMGENLVGTLVRQADVFIGGRIAGVAALGTYSLPRDLSLRLAMVVNPIITRVGFPLMARLQGDRNALKSVYLQTLRMTASINFPAYIALGLFADEVVAVLYGPAWEPAAFYLRIAAAWGLLRSVGNPVGSLLHAVGRARLAFWWNLSLIGLCVPLLWLGAHSGGMPGLAWTMLLLQVVIFLPSFYFLVRPACGAGLKAFLGVLLPPLMLAMIAGAMAHVLTLWCEVSILRLLLGTSLGALIYVLLSVWLNRTWVDAMLTLLKLDRMTKPTPAILDTHHE